MRAEAVGSGWELSSFEVISMNEDESWWCEHLHFNLHTSERCLGNTVEHRGLEIAISISNRSRRVRNVQKEGWDCLWRSGGVENRDLRRILGLGGHRYGEPSGCSLPHSGVGEDRSEVGDEPKTANPGARRFVNSASKTVSTQNETLKIVFSIEFWV